MEKKSIIDVQSVSVSLETKQRENKTYKTEEELLKDRHEMYKSGMHTMKQIYRDLDPAVTENNKAADGQLKLSVKYVKDQQLLLTKVLEARNLEPMSVRGRSFRPFVKVEVLLGNVLMRDHRTITSKTKNPIFNEIFATDVNPEDINSCKIRFSMYSSDGSCNDDFLGEVVLLVDELSCVNEARTMWIKLQPHIDLSINGHLKLTISYKLPRTLSVTVHEANGITPRNNSKIFIRLYVPGVPEVCNTWPIDIQSPLNWNETYHFNVPKEELESRTVIAMVMDDEQIEEYFGECHVQLADFNYARAYSNKFQLTDMRGSTVVRSRWAQNAITQELQESMRAHAIYMRPAFMFNSNSDVTKTISVSVPKAKAHSRRRVVNGVIIR